MSNTQFSNNGIGDFLSAYYNGGSNGFNFISLHTTNPGTSGASGEIAGGSYSRVASTWTNPAGSSTMAGATVTINVPAGATGVDWFGIWTAVSSGTYLGSGVLPASETYGSAGTYIITPTIAGSG